MTAASSQAQPHLLRSPAEAGEVTRRYPVLRSLQGAPYNGFITLVFFFEALGWFRRGSSVAVAVLTLLLLPLAIASSIWIYRYLNRTFGVVKLRHVGWISWSSAALFVIGVFEVFFGNVDVGAVAFGLWAMTHALHDRGFRKHWLLPAIVGFAMPLVIPYRTPGGGHTPFTSFCLAILYATFTVAQVWDHRLLVRSFDDGPTT